MNLSTGNDYSFLFGSQSSSNESTGFSLNDYASIKNGSYGKLLKSYYKEQKNEGKTAADVKKETQTKGAEYSEIASLADKFEKSTNKLLSSSSDLFELKDVTKKNEDGVENTTKEYDMDAILSAVKDFAKSYNDFMSKATKSTNKNVARRAENLAGQMTNYYKQLKSAGIEFNEDGSLKVNEDTIKKADVSALKRVFNGKDSLLNQVANKVDQIGTSAQSAAKNLKGYTSSAKYANDASVVGNILNGQV